ncbi:MAG: transcription-repair coupling factor [Acidobacteria bacterium]|nr:transcription-repair coupling factor [Acidobacteriota bacterium]
MNWLSRIEADENFTRAANALRAGRRIIHLSGLTGGAKALALSALAHTTGRRLALVGASAPDIENLERDLRYFSSALNPDGNPEEDIFTLPATELDPYSGTSPHAELLERRALALWRMSSGGGRVVLLTARALAGRYIAPDEIKGAGVPLAVGDEVPLDYLIEHLHSVGYVRMDPVGGVGEFSSRGGILDFYSPAGQAHPVRVEFFGDEIDSIRHFDPETQRSIAMADKALIAPMRDERSRAADFRRWAQKAREYWSDQRYARALRDRTRQADDGEAFPGWEYLMPLLHPLTHSIFDYLGDSILVVDEPAEVEKRLRSSLEALALGFRRTDEADDLALAPEHLFLTPEELRAGIGRAVRVELRLLGGAAHAFEDELSTEEVSAAAVFADAKQERFAAFVHRPPSSPLFLFPPEPQPRDMNIASRAVRRWHGRLADLARELKTPASAASQTVFVLPASGAIDRLREVFREYEVPGVSLDSARNAPDPGSVILTLGDLSGGFALPGSELVVYTERDLFDETSAAERPATQRKPRTGAFLSDFRDLKIGDFVVHIDHGIGQFQGLVQLAVEQSLSPLEAYARMTGGDANTAVAARREYMLLTYADGAKLYVPVERLDLVQKFSSGEGHAPPLDRLGGIAWQKTKARAKRAMRDMAEELLKLYAERKLVSGYAFSGDTPWQQEFEDSFPYELTPDQATAIAEAKADLEQPLPMDRLLCGDVGYGKTEVAMRAAFKAVMDGKQVAVLAPTTVLAYQHFQTFRARFAAFPVTIDLLSRFRSPKEQREVVAAVERGSVDILIGTHRILSRDLSFKDLGLVVVDEEQRFGVAHKERLKQMKKRVDVLTLSATPIPRTLNMSLLGLRDMSVIETPPRDRLAIQTNVVPLSENVIRSAIEQELQRQGQVFFVHNRVESIAAVGELVQRIAPSARIVVAHGQMGEKEMESAVLDFVAYKYDVLVATTIIENGIDIPRANTIIINRADTYGLSQLYQLRGRVGRSNRRAYAYLLIPSEQELSPVARKRLAAIREFSDLGAGFRIAALDLELRGAGNLLGGQQSGHIEAIGFDLYCQMLERTVAELRGEDIEEEIGTQINLGIDTRIPDEYIEDMSQRLRTYKRIASARSEDELKRIGQEIADRYGRLPEAVENLLVYSNLRREAIRLGIASIDRVGETLNIKFAERTRVEPERLMRLLDERKTAQFQPHGVLKVKIEGGVPQAVAGVLQALGGE